MDIWDNERRYREGELVRVGQAIERVALERGLSGRDLRPGPHEFTTVIDVAPLARAQQDTAHAVDGLWSAALGNGVILKRIEGVEERIYGVQREALDVLYGTKSVLQHGFTFLGVCLGGIAGELGEVNRNLIRANDLLRLQVDETRLQGELTRAQTAELTSLQIKEDWKRTQVQEEGADRRHQEQMRALQTPAATRANEKYGHAVTQYDTGNLGSCVGDLDAALDEQSTHAPSYILLGVCAYEAGQPAVAKAAFRKAADYAIHDGLTEIYTDAMLRLARLERLVGNHNRGIRVIREAIRAVKQGSGLYIKLCYEEVQARFVRPDRTESLGGIAVGLRQVFKMDPSLRDEVASSHFWKEVVDADPYLRYGNAPFILLAEMMKPCADPDVYTMTLHICEAGRRSLPDAVRKHLEWLQGELHFHSHVSMGGEESGRGYEQMLLFLFRSLQARGEAGEATRVLYAEHAMIKWRMSFVEFERFKLEIGDKPVDDALIVRIKMDLRRILRARPELRDEVARDRLFATCRERCPWLGSGNSRSAEIIEAVGVVLPSVSALSVTGQLKHDLDDLARMVWSYGWEIKSEPNQLQFKPRDVTVWTETANEHIQRLAEEAQNERNRERNQHFMEKVQPLFLRLADAWGPSSLEKLSSLVQEEATQILFLSLMAHPCTEASQLPEFEERLERVYGVRNVVTLPPEPVYGVRNHVRVEKRLAREYRALGDARMTVATSPLFAEYRQVRAEENARLFRVKRAAEAEAERLRKEQARKALEKARAGWEQARKKLSLLDKHLKSSAGNRHHYSVPSMLSRFYVGYRLMMKYGDRIDSLMRESDESSSGEALASWCRGRTQDINSLLRDVARTEMEMNENLSEARHSLFVTTIGVILILVPIGFGLYVHYGVDPASLPLRGPLPLLMLYGLMSGFLLLCFFLPDLIRAIKALRS